MLKSFIPRQSSARSLLRPLKSSAPSAFYLVPRRGFASEASEHDVIVIGMYVRGGVTLELCLLVIYRWRSGRICCGHQSCSGGIEGEWTIALQVDSGNRTLMYFLLDRLY